MSEIIYKNGMTRNYQNYINHIKRQAETRMQAGSRTGESFLDVVNKYAATAVIAETYQPEPVSTQDMTMEEYKEYISDRLSRIPMHPSQMQNSVAIHISEAGFEAMKNDPEYEEWVIGWLEKDMACNNPWSGICGGQYVVHYIGATKEEYRGQSWYPAYQNGKGESLFNQKAEGSFWERRLKRQEMEMQRVQRLSALQLQMMQGQSAALSQLILGGMAGSDINI